MFALFFLLRLDYANSELFLGDIPVQKTNRNRSDIQRMVMMMQLAILADDGMLDYSYVSGNINNVTHCLI